MSDDHDSGPEDDQDGLAEPDELEDHRSSDDADDAADFETIPGPLFWPAIPATDIEAHWIALRSWVETLVVRYPHLDHHVIPRCWWRHNGHVEALQALRDHERNSFARSAAPTAATDWQWRFALVEGRLREWTAHAGCGAVHREADVGVPPPEPNEWDAMVASDEDGRKQREYADRVPSPGGDR